MAKIVGRLLRIAARLTRISIVSTLVAAAIIAVRHKLETPQRLASALAGEDHIYRWKWGHIFYKALGSTDAPPLVLLHTPGIGASAYEMRSIIEPLAQHYRVYAPDLLGFGLSDRPQINYSAETYIKLCHDFIREVVVRPATLLATCLSCNYAVAVAANTPELCERLVLISPIRLLGDKREDMMGQNNGQKQVEQAQSRSPLQKIRRTLLETPIVTWLLYGMLSTRLAYQVLGGGMGSDSKIERDYFYATTHQFGAQYAPMALLADKLAHNASQQFEALQQPILILWGERALHTAGSSVDQQRLPVRSQVVLLQDASIAVHEEHPDIVVANIQAWAEEEISKEDTDAESR